MGWFRRILCWLVLLATGLCAAPPDVLVINSYAPGYAWSDDMLKGVLTTFSQTHLEFEPVIQYLDYRRFTDPQREVWLLQDIALKCRVRPPQLIITLDNPAFEFALRHREQLGRDIPLVFGGLNRFAPDMVAGQRAITGVSEESDYSGTFQLIQALRPRARHVLVIGNQTGSSLEKRRNFEEHAAEHAARLTYEYFEDWTNAQLIERVAALPDDWVGVILDVTRDASGQNNYNNPEFSTALATLSRVPLFLTARPPGDNDWSLYSWDGIGGGMVVAELHGAKVAELALRILKGEAADAIPVVPHSPQRLEVDYRQMKRFGLDLGLLPPGTVVINPPVTQYQVNRGLIIQAGLLLVTMGAVIMVLLVNILRRKRAEHALRQAEERLRTAQKLEAVGLLAGGVAHDFNNILHVIRGHTEFLRESVAEVPQAREDVATIRMAAERASQLTQQLLAFGRKQPLKSEPLDPNELVAGVVRLLRRVLGEHIELQTDLLPGPAVLVADHGQIEQVLINLCVNARDAMPEGGRITISLQLTDTGESDEHQELKPGPYLLLTVADNGPGMAPEVQARLFEPFYTTKEMGHGTGLGLAVVYGIVRQHGGSIHVSSEPGQGASFRILLPLGRAEQVPVREKNVTPPPRGEGTILLAEDDPNVRNVAIRFLERGGFQVIAAIDGVEAEELLRQHHPRIRLAILDVIMPRRNGRQVFDFIKQHHASIPVLFCSGYSAEMLPPGSVPTQQFELLHKPYTYEQLIERVQRALHPG